MRLLPIAMQRESVTAPTDADCLAFSRAELGLDLHCYSPQQIQNAYDITPLLNAGFTGRGQTIIIVDAFGSPTIEHDLKMFDAAYPLPAPPSLTVLSPLGTVPFNFFDKDQRDWALETTLDVEWAHAVAPEAAIVVLTTPVAETEGVQGMPEMLFVEQYALDHHLGRII